MRCSIPVQTGREALEASAHARKTLRQLRTLRARRHDACHVPWRRFDAIRGPGGGAGHTRLQVRGGPVTALEEPRRRRRRPRLREHPDGGACQQRDKE